MLRKPLLLPFSSSTTALSLHQIRGQEVLEHADDNQTAEPNECPAEIVANNLAFVAHIFAGRDADAGRLGRDRLANFRADRVERWEKQDGKAQQFANLKLYKAKEAVRGGVAARQGDADPTQDGREQDKPGADLLKACGQR